VTVSPVQIIAAQAKGLINVTALAKACDEFSFPFFLACVILDKETDGRNIYGHDVGGIFTYPDGRNVEVTEANYAEFLRRLAAGETSNGVGCFQLTFRGYHIGSQSLTALGYKAWIPADNIRYAIGRILAPSLKAGLARGLTIEQAFWQTAKSYNGNTSYADDAIVRARTWAATVGTSDMDPTPPPEEPPVAERIPFRGLGLTCSCVVESLGWVELDMIQRGIIKESIDIKQLGYRDDVTASAGTHARGGCVDVAQRSAAAIDVWRRWGWTMQDRSPWFPEAPHAHGWPYGCPHLSDAAKAQRTDWNNRRNGLVNNEPVIGRWPVDKWDVALERMVPTLFTEKDIAKSVLNLDGVITNTGIDPDPANKFVALRTVAETLGRFMAAQKKTNDSLIATLKSTNAKLDALTAAVGKLIPPTEPPTT
jgi:hypothetical protein